MTEVCCDFFLVWEVVPKLMIAAKLQAFQNFILSAWMKLCIQHLNHFGNFGLKYAGFSFQPLYWIFRLRFYKIIVLCGQVLLSERYNGDSGVFISRIKPRVVLIVIAYIFYLLLRFKSKTKSALCSKADLKLLVQRILSFCFALCKRFLYI